MSEALVATDVAIDERPSVGRAGLAGRWIELRNAHRLQSGQLAWEAEITDNLRGIYEKLRKNGATNAEMSKVEALLSIQASH